MVEKIDFMAIFVQSIPSLLSLAFHFQFFFSLIVYIEFWLSYDSQFLSFSLFFLILHSFFFILNWELKWGKKHLYEIEFFSYHDLYKNFDSTWKIKLRKSWWKKEREEKVLMHLSNRAVRKEQRKNSILSQIHSQIGCMRNDINNMSIRLHCSSIICALSLALSIHHFVIKCPIKIIFLVGRKEARNLWAKWQAGLKNFTHTIENKKFLHISWCWRTLRMCEI